MTMPHKRAEALIKTFSQRRVAVVGDLMLDRYIWGSAARISQEAPVPIVAVKKTTDRLGGAANVLNNLRALGARARAFGVVGDDGAGGTLVALLRDRDVDTSGVLTDPVRETTTKTRIIAGNQQVARVDREVTTPISPAARESILGQLRASVDSEQADAIILQDYHKGVITHDLVREVVGISIGVGIPVVLDPHPSNPLNVTGLTLMTPNRAEAFGLAGLPWAESVAPVENDTALLQCARRLDELWPATNVLVTLGEHGSALFERGRFICSVPTTAREVFDVSGAGDTVVASYTLAMISGATPQEACEVGNQAAGVVVAKVGTATVTADELLEAFRSE